MIQDVAAALESWRDDPAVHLVVIEAEGERAFCAGGDVRSIRDWIIAGDHAQIDAFFVQEYALNRVIARYPKPYVALIDGIWMGGGVGLSVHGSYRVVSEFAKFAMPEVQVGLFPDVGASFVLPRLRGAFGLYLGLTGTRVGAADSCWLGLATHYVERERLSGLADALAVDGLGALAERARTPPLGDLPPIAELVAEIFALPSVAAILSALERRDDPWANAALAAMRTASPTSLLWTFELLRAGAGRTFEQCQQAELERTRIAMRHPDFPEGVRAMVIDKDRQPNWSAPPS
jgi:enoyl-CoA hydratase